MTWLGVGPHTPKPVLASNLWWAAFLARMQCGAAELLRQAGVKIQATSAHLTDKLCLVELICGGGGDVAVVVCPQGQVVGDHCQCVITDRTVGPQLT